MVHKDITINNLNIMKNLKAFDCVEYYKLGNLHFIFSVQQNDKIGVVHFPLIYTDVSKMETGVSAAFTSFINDRYMYDYKIILHLFNSIFQAKLTAVYFAIK